MEHVTDFVNEKLLTQKSLEKYNKLFRKGKPFRHVVIKNFLKEDIAEQLSKELQSEEFIEKQSDLFHMFQTDDLYYSKSKTLKSFNKSFLHWDLFSVIQAVTGIKFEGTVSMSGACYKKHNFLLCHDDLVEGRRIAYILYLSKDFTKKDGGRLHLYNTTKDGNARKIVDSILPTFNSLVLFEVSGKSFHAVEENVSEKDRYTIGGWFE